MPEDSIVQAIGGIVMALVFGGLFFVFVKLFRRLSGFLHLGDGGPSPEDREDDRHRS